MAIQATKQIVGFRQGRINARKYAKQQARLRDNLARGFQRKIETSFNKNVNIISRTITEDAMMSSGNVVALIDDELEKVIKAQLKRVFKAVYDYNDDSYNKITQKQEEPFDFGRSIEFEEVIAQYFSSREPLFANISRNQGILILREVERLRLEDLSVDQIGRELRKKFRRINRNRSALIARTETHSATGFAHHNYHKNVSDSYGVSMIKEWVATNDGRTRSDHAQVSGTKISMDESFKVGGREMDFVGDPKGGPANVINCRCVIVYADAEDDVTEGTVAVDDNIPDESEVLDVDYLDRDDNFLPINNPVRNPKVTASTVSSANRSRNLKQLNDRLSAHNDLYNDVYVYSSSKASRAAAGKFGVRASDEFVAYANALQPEIDEICRRLNITPIRGISSTGRKRAIAAMGDKTLKLNPRYYETYARGIGKKPSNVLQKAQIKEAIENAVENAIPDTRLFYEEIKNILTDNLTGFGVDDFLKNLETNFDYIDFTEIAKKFGIFVRLSKRKRARENFYRVTQVYHPEDWSAVAKAIKQGNDGRLWPRTIKYKLSGELRDLLNASLIKKSKIADLQAKLKVAERGGPDVAEDFFDPKLFDRSRKDNRVPFSVKNYFASNFDRGRSTYYHEIGHHYHQISRIGPTASSADYAYRWVEKKDIERLWRESGASNPIFQQASQYANKNMKERFAENFALYFMGLTDLVDPLYKKYLDDILRKSAKQRREGIDPFDKIGDYP